MIIADWDVIDSWRVDVAMNGYGTCSGQASDRSRSAARIPPPCAPRPSLPPLRPARPVQQLQRARHRLCKRIRLLGGRGRSITDAARLRYLPYLGGINPLLRRAARMRRVVCGEGGASGISLGSSSISLGSWWSWGSVGSSTFSGSSMLSASLRSFGSSTFATSDSVGTAGAAASLVPALQEVR